MGRRDRLGFTLVEVLVALLVMSIMAVMAWQGVDGVARARDFSRERLDRTLRLQTVLAQWEQDLNAMQDSRQVPALSFDGATLRLTRRDAAGMQVVAWTLRGDAWWRWSAPATVRAQELQQQWFVSQQLLGNEAGHLRMLQGVPRWQVYCFRGGAWSNCQSSADLVAPAAPPQAPPGAPPRSAPAAREQPPTGVRVVLTLAQGEREVTLTREIALAPQLP